MIEYLWKTKQKIFKLPSWELASLQFLPIAMNNGNAVFFLYVKHKDECKNNCRKNSETILIANKKKRLNSRLWICEVDEFELRIQQNWLNFLQLLRLRDESLLAQLPATNLKFMTHKQTETALNFTNKWLTPILHV